jgi:hypothetical protein
VRNKERGRSSLDARVFFILLVALYMLTSCATRTSNASPARRSQLIEQLQEARETDLSNALDTSLGPVAAGDYMIQAGKARTAISQLRAGAPVSETEVSEALFVPPRHLSLAERQQLIAQLEASKQLDQARWREHLGGWDPILTEDCAVQEKRAQQSIDALETDRPISWQEINEAMTVPNEYYW